VNDLVRPAIIAAGLALGGLFIGGGFARARSADRFVTVKGISEREVKADLAIWPLRSKRRSDGGEHTAPVESREDSSLPRR
jgi:hypothetical protein